MKNVKIIRFVIIYLLLQLPFLSNITGIMVDEPWYACAGQSAILCDSSSSSLWLSSTYI